MDLFIFLFVLITVNISFQMFHNWRIKVPRLHSYSIIAVCRNEAPRLVLFFASLEKLNYPADMYEIILVDDASNDGSAQMIRDFSASQQNVKAFFISQEDKIHAGKRQALSLAASHATGEILLMTDADTEVPANWIESYNHYFDLQIGMVIGYVREKQLGMVKRVKKIFAAGIFSASVGIGMPFSCSGGNLAIRRAVFEEVGGYDKLGSFHAGDDKLLLKKVHQAWHKVAYNAETVVYEQSRYYTMKEKFDREIRQYGKFKQSSFFYQFLTVLMLFLCIYLPIRIISNHSWILFLEAVFPLFFFYGMSLIRHREKFYPADFLFIIVYPYYGIFYTIIGTFKKAKWKA